MDDADFICALIETSAHADHGGLDPDCPHADGPYHFWTCDGPFTVYCDNCGAGGRTTMTSEGSP